MTSKAKLRKELANLDSGEEDPDADPNIKNEELLFNPESKLRNWLKSRGKDHCIDFEDEELR